MSTYEICNQHVFAFRISGVGMYQHDVSEQKLAKTLDAIVTECVSFVGEFSHISVCLCRGGATSNIVTGAKGGTIFWCVLLLHYRIIWENNPFSQSETCRGLSP